MKIDVIVAIGGDDTQSYALRLHKEGFPVVSIPKTMDNDIYGTDYCIGFSTAVTRSVDHITALRRVAGSRERIAVVELFGCNSGETSLISADLATDLILRKETGKLVALREGKYTHIPIENMMYGLKRVDVEQLYDTKQYRPKVAQMLGKPMFLY